MPLQHVSEGYLHCYIAWQYYIAWQCRHQRLLRGHTLQRFVVSCGNGKTVWAWASWSVARWLLVQDVESSQAALQNKEEACQAAEHAVTSGRLQLEASRCCY